MVEDARDGSGAYVNILYPDSHEIAATLEWNRRRYRESVNTMICNVTTAYLAEAEVEYEICAWLCSILDIN